MITDVCEDKPVSCCSNKNVFVHLLFSTGIPKHSNDVETELTGAVLTLVIESVWRARSFIYSVTCQLLVIRGKFVGGRWTCLTFYTHEFVC